MDSGDGSSVSALRQGTIGYGISCAENYLRYCNCNLETLKGGTLELSNEKSAFPVMSFSNELNPLPLFRPLHDLCVFLRPIQSPQHR